jgi:hypothetical protein
MSQDWRSLRMGDRIRFLRMPSTYSKPEYNVPPDTLALYTLLISTGDVLEIDDFLEDGFPVASYVDRRDSNNPVLHGLLIDEVDDGCWEIVPANGLTRRCS